MAGYEGISTQVGGEVRLRFSDGEIVDARIVAVDYAEQFDCTDEVLAIIQAGTPPVVGTSVGALCLAPLNDLGSWAICTGPAAPVLPPETEVD